jgi:hypothetical protein
MDEQTLAYDMLLGQDTVTALVARGVRNTEHDIKVLEYYSLDSISFTRTFSLSEI